MTKARVFFCLQLFFASLVAAFLIVPAVLSMIAGVTVNYFQGIRSGVTLHWIGQVWQLYADTIGRSFEVALATLLITLVVGVPAAYALHVRGGWLARLVEEVIVLPIAIPGLATALALLLTYGTTIYALASRAALKPGETLLVLGASGGVGMAAVELGKALGATVVAGASSAEKCEIAARAGADRTVVYPRGPFDKDQSKALAALFKDAVGADGADVIYDPLGGGYSEPALRAIAWNGRFLVIGFVDGIARLPLNLPLLKECSVVGTLWGEFTKRDPAGLRKQVDQLFALWADGIGSKWTTGAVTRDPDTLRALGIDPAHCKYLLLKSRIHYRAGFSIYEKHRITLDGDGVTTSDNSRLTYKRLKRPIYPFN